MSAMFLNDTELRELTRRERYGAQVRALRRMGIEHRVRPDGSVLVLRSHVTEMFGAGVRPSANEQEPNWEAI